MKTKSLLFVWPMLLLAGTSFAVNHGSIIKKNAPLNVVILDNPEDVFPAGATIDLKAVTVGDKLWAIAVGKGYTLAGNKWSSQIRIYSPGLHEISSNNDPNYITVDRNKLTTVVTAFPYKSLRFNFTKISICQEQQNDFNGTATWDYNVAAANSGLTGDTEKPELTKAEPGEQTGASLPVSFEATDNSGDFFYHISDATNGFEAVLFSNTGTLTGLKADTDYNFTVVAIDFSGNESDPLTFTNGGAQPFESIVEGVAGDADFFIHSTGNSFTIYGKTLASGATFNMFGIQVGTPETTFVTGENAYPVPVQAVVGTGGNDLDFPGVASFSKTITNVSGNAGGIVRLNFIYITGPNDEPASAEGWANLYGGIKYAGKLTVGPRTGEYIDFKLGDSSSKEPSTGFQKVDKAGAMSISQNQESIVIHSSGAIQSTALYSVSGQWIGSGTSPVITTVQLAKGVYILKAQDVKGVVNTFKVVIK